MTSEVRLKASGYTWECPECGRHNYTGPAPEEVRCEGCNGVFYVSDLSHRRRRRPGEAAHSDDGRGKPKEVVPSEFQARLFPCESNRHDLDQSDDIPF